MASLVARIVPPAANENAPGPLPFFSFKGAASTVPVDDIAAEMLAAASALQLPERSVEGEQMANDQELVDAKIGKLSAEVDTKFAQLLGAINTQSSDIKGEIGKIGARLDGVERSTGGVKATIVGVAIGAIAIVIGILSFGQQYFGIGVTTRDIIRATVSEERIQHPATMPPPNNSK
jgi:hypothetical protein